MAVAATRPLQAPHNMSSSTYRQQAANGTSTYGTIYASPTDSEFSETYEDDSENVRTWDERRVGDWLKSINAGQYVDLFKNNNINGENLMDIDQNVLKEIGVMKVGDRVRIGSQVKLFRNKEYRRKRPVNRDSLMVPDNHTPPSSASPVPSRTIPLKQTSREDKRVSRVMGNGFGPGTATAVYVQNGRNGSRPASPLYVNTDPYNSRGPRHGGSSPREVQDRDRKDSYRNVPPSSSGGSARTPRPPVETPRSAVFKPGNQSLVKVIGETGTSWHVDLSGCRNAEDMTSRMLKQARIKEDQKHNYAVFVMDGTEPNYANCRRLSTTELYNIGVDTRRPERQRLMLRNLLYGDPEGAQLHASAAVAREQYMPNAPSGAYMPPKSRNKIEKLTGESLPSLSYPMSQASVQRREEHINSTALDLESSEPSQPLPARPRPRKVDSFDGERPESQFVVADPATYFPDVKRDEIEKTVRMSQRRSQRLSRANSRLSTASRLSMVSNFSVGSSSTDVPAVPAIPDTFANGQNTPIRARPLSILRLGRPHSSYRDSVASSTLEPLEEDSSYEPNRKSYVSFGGDSTPGSATVSISEAEGTIRESSYFEDGGSSSPMTENGGSLNEQLRDALNEDGEEPDPELNEFITTGGSWDNIKYIRGKLIGQGSFGSVFMALHTLTAELMAVKQVELPSTSGTALDAKKNNMVEALKREIALLRELKHPHIVQYLGASSEKNTLNIFLEYVPGGSIAKMLIDYGPMQEVMVSRLTRQVLVGLAYLHSKDIIHRDIKGANILVDSHGAVKISDFGISKRVQDSKTLLEEDGAPKTGGRMAAHRVSLQGSVFWMAPEVVKQTAYTRKADIWSLGCLVVEMLTGVHPHPNSSQLQAIFKIGGKGTQTDPSPDVPKTAGKDARELLRATFRVEYEARPEARELLDMAFVKQGQR